jgi:hypothetical protein
MSFSPFQDRIANLVIALCALPFGVAVLGLFAHVASRML